MSVFTSSCTHTRPFVLGLKVDPTDLLKVRLTPHTIYNNKKAENLLFVLF